MFSSSQILDVSKRLFPKGKAFLFVPGGVMDKILLGLAKSEARLLDDMVGIYDSMFPDNENFTEEDAINWEKKLGIVARVGVSLANRKLAICQKMFYPSSDAPRQHYLYIQEQLRAAGFDVYVHLNPLGMAPEDALALVDATQHQTTLEHEDTVEHSGFGLFASIHSDDLMHGDEVEHGAGYDNIVVNYVDADKDATYVFNNNYKFSFFIAGLTYTDFASVSLERKEEFRQLILQLKPMHTQAILYINYN